MSTVTTTPAAGPSRRQCPNGSGCPWSLDPKHMTEYTHPCSLGTKCTDASPGHRAAFLHDTAATAEGTPPAAAASSAGGRKVEEDAQGPYVPPVTHNARCDHCGISQIKGFRYKCMFCPDYDLCHKCSGIRGVHDASHPLVRFTTTTFRSPTFLNRKTMVHTGHACGACGKRDIVGVRYVCTVDGTSLCESCELMGVHDPSHARLKLAAASPASVHVPPPPVYPIYPPVDFRVSTHPHGFPPMAMSRAGVQPRPTPPSVMPGASSVYQRQFQQHQHPPTAHAAPASGKVTAAMHFTSASASRGALAPAASAASASPAGMLGALHPGYAPFAATGYPGSYPSVHGYTHAHGHHLMSG